MLLKPFSTCTGVGNILVVPIAETDQKANKQINQPNIIMVVVEVFKFSKGVNNFFILIILFDKGMRFFCNLQIKNPLSGIFIMTVFA
jgi:hypothetical protein